MANSKYGPIHYLKHVKALLVTAKLCFNVAIVPREVPFAEFVCPLGGYAVKIFINKAEKIVSAEWLNKWLLAEPSLGPISMIVKQMLDAEGLNVVSLGGTSGDSVMLMIISLYQVGRVLVYEDLGGL